MTEVSARNHFPFDSTPTLNDVAVGWGSYTTGELIDGTKGNLKAWAHIFDARPVKILSSVTTATETTITTRTDHGLATGQWIAIHGHKTNTGINNDVYEVTVDDENTFTIAYTTGTASGTGGELFIVLKSATGTYLKELILTKSSATNTATYDLYVGIEEPEEAHNIFVEIWRFFTDNSAGRISDLLGATDSDRILLKPTIGSGS